VDRCVKRGVCEGIWVECVINYTCIRWKRCICLPLVIASLPAAVSPGIRSVVLAVSVHALLLLDLVVQLATVP
jgi:hypothetical protein